MARGRMLSKSLSTSTKRAALHATAPDLAEFCQQLYPLIVAHADDFGRLAGDTFTVKLAIDPSSPRPEQDFDQALSALHRVGLIQRYTDPAGRWIIAIVDFDEHQTGLHKRTESKFAAPPIPPPSRKFPEIPASRARAELNRTELKGTEGKGTKEGKNAAAPLAHPTKTAKPKPKVNVLARMVREDVLPLGLKADDLAEAAKARAASLRLPYDGRSIASAIASATAQVKKPRARAS